MNIREVAAVTKISVRTLHHYDKIGLISPKRNPGNDYRVYTDEDLDRLQQVLFFRACGFRLEKIAAILEHPEFDRKVALLLQKRALLHERDRIDAMLATLERTLDDSKGVTFMSQEEKFSGFDFSRNPYEEEARQRWGDEAVDRSKKAVSSMTKAEQQALSQEMEDLFSRLSQLLGKAVDSDEVQAAMGDMFAFFNQNFGNQYSLESFAWLGQLYVSDARFTQNIDQYGKGLAAFLA